ncbi:MAG: GNAT family N-acetyltransferase, partial [Clostridium sp.]
NEYRILRGDENINTLLKLKGKVEFIERIPTVDEYIKLRKDSGWKILSKEKIEQGLKNSTYCLCVEYDDSIIGMARVVGDGTTVFYIQDVIVLNEFQNCNIGSYLMRCIMEYLKKYDEDGVIIGLIAKSELKQFYKRFGFKNNIENGFYRSNR